MTFLLFFFFQNALIKSGCTLGKTMDFVTLNCKSLICIGFCSQSASQNLKKICARHKKFWDTRSFGGA